jgi:plasmid stabilization system protein ParE
MDYKIVFSQPAIEDLEGIVRFIAQDNPAAAAQFGGKLIDSVRKLAAFPHLGRVVPEKNDEHIREIILRPYRIFYRVKDSARTVEIARFWHAPRGEPHI